MTLVNELSEIVEQLEDVQAGDEFPSALLSDFSQKVDRIMGAAKTIGMMDPDHAGLKRIGAIAEVCKRLGYRASEAKKAQLIPLFAGFWADTLEVMQDLLEILDDDAASKAKAQGFGAVLQKRLEWLGSKLDAPQAAGGAPAAGASSVQSEIDALLKELG